MASKSNAQSIVNGIKTTAIAIIALGAICLQTGIREYEKSERHSNVAYLEKLIAISDLLQHRAGDLKPSSNLTVQDVIGDTEPSVRESPVLVTLATDKKLESLSELISATPRSTFATVADPLGICQPIVVKGKTDASIPVLWPEEIPGFQPRLTAHQVSWGSAYLVSFHTICLNVGLLQPFPFLVFVNFPVQDYVALYLHQSVLKFVGIESLYRAPIKMGGQSGEPILNFVPIDYSVFKSAALNALGRINGKIYEPNKLDQAIRDSLSPAKNDFTVLGVQIDSHLFSTIIPLAFLSFWILQVMNVRALALDLAKFGYRQLDSSEPWPLVSQRDWPELLLICLVAPILLFSPIMVAFALFEVQHPIALQILGLFTNLQSWNAPYLLTIVGNSTFYIAIYNVVAIVVATYCCVSTAITFVALRYASQTPTRNDDRTKRLKTRSVNRR